MPKTAIFRFQMDDIPYDFIDRVFTKLDPDDINAICLDCPLWAEVARVYTENVRKYSVRLLISAEGFSYEIKGIDPNYIALDDMNTLDLRFHRIQDFTVWNAEIIEGKYQLPVARLPELIRLVSWFNLNLISFEFLRADVADNAKLVIDEFAKYELSLKLLQLDHFPGSEELLTNMLKIEELCSIYLSDDCPPAFSQHHGQFEAFVCRPHFKLLGSDEELFDFEAIKRIVAYWRTMKTPWVRAEIQQRSVENENLFEQLASWMNPNCSVEGEKRLLEVNGEYTFVAVLDCEECLNLTFSRK